MKIVFRVDASIEMGIGHAMRCLTLADALKSKGAQCSFVCREHPGNLLGQIAARGYKVHSLPLCQSTQQTDYRNLRATKSAHASWLGSDWESDASQTAACIGSQEADWLIVDHYALDKRWEKRLRPSCRKIMVIDDLADRTHDCDLLLDQTYGRSEDDYRQRVPTDCRLITGAKYALLREEFATLREYSLKRRQDPKLEHLLITMGGVDKDNVTGKVLQALTQCNVSSICRVTVVMGKNAPWLEDVVSRAEVLPWPAEVRINVTDMPQLMADSDLAIGATGGTAWERCCLGVPTLILTLAENQYEIARVLVEAKAVLIFDDKESSRQLTELSTEALKRMSHAAREITDGLGTGHVTRCLKEM